MSGAFVLASSILGIFSVLGSALAIVYRYFYVHVDPDEFVVHYRGGMIKNIGRGISFFALPYDTYIKVPGTLRDVNFCADQVTKERQGVRVQGFLAYKITRFEDSYQTLDFKATQVKAQIPCAENMQMDGYEEKNRTRTVVLDSSDPLAKTDYVLRQLAESVVRHEVSNRSLEEMISERKKVIDSMRAKLLEVSTGWGLSIETIEFTEVWIRSKEVFENLQAEYRNELKLHSEGSTYKTRQDIEQKRIETEQRLAEMESEADRARRIKASQEQALASRSELESRRAIREQEIETERQIRDQERENKHKSALTEMHLARERELKEKDNLLAKQEDDHRISLDRKLKEEEIRRKEVETEKVIRLLNIETEIEAAEKRADREKAEAAIEEERKRAQAREQEIDAEANASRIRIMARARREAQEEEARGVALRGEADGAAIRSRISAQNTVNARHIQRELVGEISKMAKEMQVKDVSWINIAGDNGGSPLGIIPRNILETVAVFKGLGVGLEDIMTGPAKARASRAEALNAPVEAEASEASGGSVEGADESTGHGAQHSDYPAETDVD